MGRRTTMKSIAFTGRKMILVLATLLVTLLVIAAADVFSLQYAQAEELTPITQLWVGTTRVVHEGVVQSTTSGEGWSYDSATQTLTLNGANITVSESTGAGENSDEIYALTVGLYCLGDLNLVVSGTNRITASAGLVTPGIYVKKGNLYVTGEGSLVASGTKRGITVSPNSLYDSNSGRLYVSDRVRLTGEATLIGASALYGIKAHEIAVSGSAQLEGYAAAGFWSYGINCTTGNITVGSSATMIARADDGYSGESCSSYGLIAGDVLLGKGQISVEGILVASAGNATSKGWASGIELVNTDLVVTGNGSVRAECGDPASANEAAYGLRTSGALGGQIFINGGGFLASGGTGAVFPATTRVTINEPPVIYEVSSNRDGSNPTVFNSTEEWEEVNGSFGAYKYIKATTIFDVFVNGTQVNRVNRHDVLGDGTISYQPADGASPARLILSGANIPGTIQLDGTTEVALIGESTVGTLETTGALHLTGEGGLTIAQALDCGSSELTIATASGLTLRGAITVGALVNNGNLINEGNTPITLSNLTNNGSFTNVGNLTVAGDFIGTGSISNTGRMDLTGTFTSSGAILNEGMLILPEATEEQIAQGITGEGLNEVRGNSGAASTFYINGTLLKTILHSMDFTRDAGIGIGLGGWSTEAVLDADGYQWNAESKTLLLKNLMVRSADDYGVMVPDGTTVVLQGINVIDSEGDYGIFADGELTVQGSGTLRSNEPEVEVLYAEQLIITGGAKITINGITSFDKYTQSSVTVSDNAVLVSTKSIRIGSYTQEGNANVRVEAINRPGVMTYGNLLINGGNLTVRSSIMALVAAGTEARPGSVIIGRGMMIATPPGAKLADVAIQLGGVNGTITSVLAGNEASLSVTLGDTGGITGTNAIRELIITRQPSGGSSGGDSSFTGIPLPEDGIPVIKNANNKAGWEAIKEQLSQSKDGDTVTVEMKGSSIVPREVFGTIRGTDVTLIFEMGEGITWRVNGQSITENTLENIDFGVTMDTDAIPENLIHEIAGNQANRGISLSHNGDFGFRAMLSINMEKKNAGRYTNLFYYNPTSGKLELQSIEKVNEEGIVEFEFTHASDYTAVLSTEPMYVNAFDQIAISTTKGTLYVGGTINKSMSLKVEMPELLKDSMERGSSPFVITYQSSDPKVATVTSTGKITAKKAGEATITTQVEIGGKQTSFQTVIKVNKAFVKLTKSAKSMKKGKTFTFQAEGYGVNTEDIKFYTSKKSIVVINKTTGKAVAKTTGTDYVIARAGKVEVKLKVKVNE